jgi:hypothetical protein
VLEHQTIKIEPLARSDLRFLALHMKKIGSISGADPGSESSSG